MSDDTTKVTITLRKSVADRLKAMCHNRNQTASLLIDRWVFEHDDSGNLKKNSREGTPGENVVDDMMSRIFRGRR